MKKRILALVLSLVLLIGLLPISSLAAKTSGLSNFKNVKFFAEKTFTDVLANDWFYDNVKTAYELGLMVGNSKTTFNPKGNLTIAEAITAAARLHSIYYTGSKSFKESSPWYQTYVDYAQKNGIISGKYENYNKLATRAEFAQILASSLPAEALPEISQIDDNAIPDVKMSNAKADSIYKLYRAGILSGVDKKGTFTPNNNIRRSEVAAIVSRMAKQDLRTSIKLVATSNEQTIFLNNSLYSEVPNVNNIEEDAETGLEFINNELIVHAELNTNRDDIVRLLKSYGGVVVGEIATLNTYQVRFENTYHYAQLKELQNTFESSSLISWASANLVLYQESDFFPKSDTEWVSEWDKSGNGVPSGLNWGVEAINALGAWDYKDIMQNTRIGVMDWNIVEHNDLTYKKVWYNSPPKDIEHVGYHGTHVAGTIAAGFDNGKGIAGVSPCSELYCFNMTGVPSLNKEEEQQYLFQYELALGALITEDKCRALNVSANTGRLECFAASHGNKKAELYIMENAAELGKFLKGIIDARNDFVICVAAGNVNGYKFVKNDSAKYGYLEYDYDHPNGTPIQGGAQAAYNNFLSAITIPEVKNRIIVVGACGNNNDGTYTYSSFSSIGSVDIVAPGENIHSTINNNSYDNNYNGTSMATPHVTGVAAMLYSIDPTLKGDKVKKIIKDTATKTVNGCTYKLVDAEAAVIEAYKKSPASMLSLKGRIVDKSTNLPISGASITICAKETNQVVKETKSGKSGEFSIVGIREKNSNGNSFWDSYRIKIECSEKGYSELILLNRNMIVIDKDYNIGTLELEKIADIIVGKVVDKDTNKPIKDADVVLQVNNGIEKTPLTTARTSYDGTFSLTISLGPNIPKFEYIANDSSILVQKEGYEDYTYQLIIPNANDIGTIKLSPKVIEPIIDQYITGRVVDEKNNAPIEGVYAYLISDFGVGGEDGSAFDYTSKDGTFKLRNYEGVIPKRIEFSKDDYSSYAYKLINNFDGVSFDIGTVKLSK